MCRIRNKWTCWTYQSPDPSMTYKCHFVLETWIYEVQSTTYVVVALVITIRTFSKDMDLLIVIYCYGFYWYSKYTGYFVFYLRKGLVERNNHSGVWVR